MVTSQSARDFDPNSGTGACDTLVTAPLLAYGLAQMRGDGVGVFKFEHGARADRWVQLGRVRSGAELRKS